MLRWCAEFYRPEEALPIRYNPESQIREHRGNDEADRLHTSPYARKVRIVLAEKKIEYDFVLDSPWANDSKVPDINPLARSRFSSSTMKRHFRLRVIVEYIDNVTPNNKLFPSSHCRERIEVKRWRSPGRRPVRRCRRRPARRQRARPRPEGAAWDCPPTRQGGLSQPSSSWLKRWATRPSAWVTHISMADLAVGTIARPRSLPLPGHRLAGSLTVPQPGQMLYDKLMQRPAFADTVPRLKPKGATTAPGNR